MLSNFWMVVALVAAAVLIVGRIVVKLRNAGKLFQESWDAKMVERLRSQGFAPFKDYFVDFFFALPDEGACQSVREQLEPQGFKVSVKPIEEDPELRYSLHAGKEMRLIVPEMEEASRRMTELAGQFRGRYDGWTV
jgi:hypothetical protein